MSHEPNKLRLILGLISLLINGLGATITFFYFSFIESGLRPGHGQTGITDSPGFFLLVFSFVSTIVLGLSVRKVRAATRELSAALDSLPAKAVPGVVGRLVNLPIFLSLYFLLGWLCAGVTYGFLPEQFRAVPSPYWRPELKIFFGIVFVGAPFTVLANFFTLDLIVKRWIQKLFPSHLLAGVPRSMRTSVFRKMIFVSALVGCAPVSVISYVTLSEIKAVDVGNQTIAQFLTQMPFVISYLLILAIVVAVGISALMARTVSDPLNQTRNAMELVRNGDMEACVPVLSNDELGSIAEGFNQMVEGLRERDFIRQTFGSYLSPDVVSEILDSPEGINLGGELRRVTILVADLRGFTPLSVTLPAEMVVSVLNTYLEAMTNLLIAHGGTIDEFTGDGILAFFGAPNRLEDPEITAVRCAVQMQADMEKVNEKLMLNFVCGTDSVDDQEGQSNVQQRLGSLLPLTMGIAINAGMLIVGNIGCEKRKKYGAVGSAINIAFRAEKFAGPGETVITHALYERIGNMYGTIPIPEVNLKGVTDDVSLYRLNI